MLKSAGIGVLLDIGANEGQYACALRRSGWTGHIVSFEPLHSAFTKLETAAEADPAWTTARIALGDVAGDFDLHISGTPMSSSLLPMLPRHEDLVPNSAYTHSETVKCARLDDVFDDFVGPVTSVALKIDVQGFEMRVLQGARNVLPRVALIELEINLDNLYEGQPDAASVVHYLNAASFRMVSAEPEHFSPTTGETSWLNATFRQM
jgi:FkbM family methyltransferase